MKPRMTDVVLPPTFEQTASAGTAAHTAGPWSHEAGKFGLESIISADGLIIAQTYCRSVGADLPAVANARLIAAAPDLLAAATAMVDIDDRDALTDPDKAATDEYRAEIWANLRAAIAAAKGGAA